MTYEQWLNGNDCCCNSHTPVPVTGECDCDDIMNQIDALSDEIDDIVIPTNVSAFNNDAGYLTEHQPLKTINGQVISGEGNIVIEGGSGSSITVDAELSTSSTNPVENKVITGALNGKLDASAYTPTDLSQYYTKQEVNAIVSGLNVTIADLQRQINELKPTPTGTTKVSGMINGVTPFELSCDTKSNLEQSDLSGISRSAITSVEIGSCISAITTPQIGGFNDGCFSDCSGLTSVTLNEGLEVIGRYSFANCHNLTSITIPSTITELGLAAFGIGSTNFNSVTILATTPPTNNGFLWDAQSVNIYVPAESVDAYKAAWTMTYAEHIYPIE